MYTDFTEVAYGKVPLQARGGEEHLKSVWGCEGQVAGYFLLRWFTKNMKIRKRNEPIVQIHENVFNQSRRKGFQK